MKTCILDINDFDDFSMRVFIEYSNRSLRIKLIFWFTHVSITMNQEKYRKLFFRR